MCPHSKQVCSMQLIEPPACPLVQPRLVPSASLLQPFLGQLKAKKLVQRKWGGHYLLDIEKRCRSRIFRPHSALLPKPLANTSSCPLQSEPKSSSLFSVLQICSYSDSSSSSAFLIFTFTFSFSNTILMATSS